jgi:hypothetical protein
METSTPLPVTPTISPLRRKRTAEALFPAGGIDVHA